MNAIWWIRRDLRLQDNPALTAAIRNSEAVLPVFVLDPNLLASPYVGPPRLGFLWAALRSLDRELRSLGRPLVVRRGEPLPILRELLSEADVHSIFAEPDYSPYACQRDRRVEAELPVEWVGAPAIRPPGTVLKADGDPYVVFTPFRDRWWGGPLPTPVEIQPTPSGLASGPKIPSDGIPEDPEYDHDAYFPASEGAARERLSRFVEGGGLNRYAELRDLVAESGTSRLSPYLRFGLLSTREAFLRARGAAKGELDDPSEGARVWLDELIWRDFYLHVLHHFPEARGASFRPKYRDLPWRNDRSEFEAWQAGKTGYPLVDAAMRQLESTGWMHNRARMVVASFLVKDLLVDWRWGERHFMQRLLDGDPASNNGGWQWAAGTGTDAAPYFRIFNPVSQSKKHDKAGHYIRQWVPELAGVPPGYIHEPWKMPAAIQEQAGCRIGRDYPAPLVDHRSARERALAAYRSLDE